MLGMEKEGGLRVARVVFGVVKRRKRLDISRE